MDDVDLNDSDIVSLPPKFGIKTSTVPYLLSKEFLKRYAQHIYKYLITEKYISSNRTCPQRLIKSKNGARTKSGNERSIANSIPTSITYRSRNLLEHNIFSDISTFLPKLSILPEK